MKTRATFETNKRVNNTSSLSINRLQLTSTHISVVSSTFHDMRKCMSCGLIFQVRNPSNPLRNVNKLNNGL